jgi:hypothetical protein
MGRKPVKRKRRSVDPDLRSTGGLRPEIAELVDRYTFPTFTDPVTGRNVTIKPNTTPDPKTGIPSRYRFFFQQQDGYLNPFDVRELPNWTQRDLARDAEKRIREAIEKGLLDISG